MHKNTPKINGNGPKSRPRIFFCLHSQFPEATLTHSSPSQSHDHPWWSFLVQAVAGEDWFSNKALKVISGDIHALHFLLDQLESRFPENLCQQTENAQTLN